MTFATNADRMTRARDSLRGRWGLAIGGTLLYFITSAGVSRIGVIGVIAAILIAGAMSLGLARFSLALARKTDTKATVVFSGFDQFGVSLAAYLLQVMFILLWALLIIVPGIVAALSYAMTFYILADDPSVGARGAIARSKVMMEGHKWRLLFLGLRFLGWALLSLLTLGIGFLWLFPYMHVSVAHFYDDVRATVAPPLSVATS